MSKPIIDITKQLYFKKFQVEPEPNSGFNLELVIAEVRLPGREESVPTEFFHLALRNYKLLKSDVQKLRDQRHALLIVGFGLLDEPQHHLVCKLLVHLDGVGWRLGLERIHLLF